MTTTWCRLAPALLWAAMLVPRPAPAQALPQAVEQAVRSNPEVLAAGSRRLAADEGLKQARAGYLPRVDISGAGGRVRLDSQSSRALGSSDSSYARHAGDVTITQMLFDGFAVSSDVERQGARIDGAAYRVGATAEDIALRTVGVYVEVLRRQETVAIGVANLQAHQHIYDQIRLGADNGVLRRADLFQAESRLALAQASLRAEEGALQDAVAAFLRVVGATPQRLSRPDSLAAVLPASEREAQQLASASHPALGAGQADIAEAEAARSLARSELWPKLDLEAGAGRDRDRVLGTTDERRVMLRLRYNLFRGNADKARINAAGFQIQEAEQNLERLRRQVQESVSLAYNAYRTAQERLASLQQYVQASDATRVAYGRQFRIGQRSLLDLLNAENEYFSARTAYVTGQYTELASQYRILAGMGLLLATLNVAPPSESMLQMGLRTGPR
ncbi:Type I secretion outer membrane protein, TolC/prtF family [Cupriavidus taiwanensis]|uniref:Type I secretion outer membrane protein, TolC/prtF family n=1 Tax=Cupriavidus taiwanensis TaxID=164546 RepID=A0A975XDZ8_9BURK|nr:TolC family outer membrane protein [Cupriavidus taiwanensis]SOY67482.1 Type I secretion outer membrane protein, TolC/prtF family [Cupriavidus taiwanensis]